MRQLRHCLAPLLLAASLAATSAAAAQGPFVLLHSLFDINTNAQANAVLEGWSVAVDGNIAVVGVPYDDTAGTNRGAVKVYDAASGSLLLKLINPDPTSDVFFGEAVAVSGTKVVVGDSYHSAGASFVGRAYVYDLDGAMPTTPMAILTNPGPASADYFGNAVSIAGTRVVIGAYLDGAGAYRSGSAYVYDLASATPGVTVLSLTNPTPATDDQFGRSVSISGTRVLVGANGDSVGAFRAGIAYVYDLNSTTPGLPALILSNPTPRVADNFGYAVAISGTRAVIGAGSHNTGTPDPGRAYVFDLVSSTPHVPIMTLTNPTPAASDYFGHAVAICGTRLVIGAYDDDTGATNAGSSYVYDLASATPAVPVATLTNPTPATNDYFGWAVAISTTWIAIGAYGDDTGGIYTGAAYLFGAPPPLNIIPATPGFATISWSPTTSSGFVLQYTDSLAPTNWVNAPSGAANPVSVPTTGASRFYRLFQP